MDGNGVCQNYLQADILEFIQMYRVNTAVCDKKIDTTYWCGGKIKNFTDFGTVCSNNTFTAASPEHFFVYQGFHIVGGGYAILSGNAINPQYTERCVYPLHKRSCHGSGIGLVSRTILAAGGNERCITVVHNGAGAGVIRDNNDVLLLDESYDLHRGGSGIQKNRVAVINKIGNGFRDLLFLQLPAFVLILI